MPMYPNGPEQEHKKPTLIGAPVAGVPDDPLVDPRVAAVVALVDLVLELHAATVNTQVSEAAMPKKFRLRNKLSPPDEA